ncbi:glycosyltransferase family 2 protein [Pedobacter frigoris]|nr:glycosyltransferase family 2 protein [Pedobacter frigoris]
MISTYNWPEALEVVLLSALNQTVLPNEIVIADDGSGAETKALIEKYAKLSQIPLHHVWQEDNGFRLAEIRNKAIAKASSDYIVQIDGDIIMHPRFIEDHVKFAKANSFVRASRIYINDEISEEMLASKKYKISAFSKGITNVFSALRMPFLWKHFENDYKIKGYELYEIHGCNMAYWRKDAIKVNGYNESFNGWGPEDKEFIARLLNTGLQKRFIKLGAIAFHIYHKENAKTFLEENTRKFKDAITNKTTYIEHGINQYT